jgi:hypothetical protein
MLVIQIPEVKSRLQYPTSGIYEYIEPTGEDPSLLQLISDGLHSKSTTCHCGSCSYMLYTDNWRWAHNALLCLDML